MQKTPIILAGAAVALALALTQAFAEVPNLNIEKTCHAAQPLLGPDPGDKTANSGDLTNANATNPYQTCMQSENAAKKSSEDLWTKVKVADRENCLGLSRMVYPSYVELMSCLQMYDPSMSGVSPADQGLPAAGRRPNRRP